MKNFKRYRNASHRTGTLWQADYRGPRLTGWWTGQQKASHGKRRIPARKLVQGGPYKLTERWKMNDVWKVINRMNKNIIHMVYSLCLIALEKIFTQLQETPAVQTGTLW